MTEYWGRSGIARNEIGRVRLDREGEEKRRFTAVILAAGDSREGRDT